MFASPIKGPADCAKVVTLLRSFSNAQDLTSISTCGATKKASVAAISDTNPTSGVSSRRLSFKATCQPEIGMRRCIVARPDSVLGTNSTRV